MYCFDVKPGKYQVWPKLTAEEKESDLHLAPEYYELEIINAPKLDANFYQSKMIVSGKVHCISECEDVELILISQRNENYKRIRIADYDGTFVFSNILSGQYKILISKDSYCFDIDYHHLKVQNAPVENIEFTQKGFSLIYKSTKTMDIKWSHEEKKTTGILKILKEENKACLPEKGIYTIEPLACFKFSQEEFKYDTDEIVTLEFRPSEYQVKTLIDTSKDALAQIGDPTWDIQIFLDEVFEGLFDN